MNEPQQLQQWHQLVALNVTDVVLVLDADDRYLWASPSITEVLGYRPDDVIGRTSRDFVPPEEQRRLEDARRGALTGVAYLDEMQVRDRQGELRWVSNRSTAVTLPDGSVGRVVVVRDVHDQVLARTEAERNAELLRAVMSSARDGFLRFGADRRVDYVNPEVVRVSGWSEEFWLGRRVTEIGYVGDAAPLYEDRLARVFADGTPQRFEFSVDHADGRRQWFEADMAPVFGTDQVVTHVISSNRDVTDRHSAQEELTYRATRDQLTGLANRTSLIDELTRALAAARRSGRHAAALMIDLDHFKVVNDSLGHAVGDELLVAAARRLERVVRSADLAGRLGGDEFVVVMRDLDDADDARQLAQRIVEAFRQPLMAHGTDLYATTSIGIATSSVHSDATDLLREADTALYVAKQLGRDRMAVFTDSLRDAVTNRLEMSGQLRPAFERSEFEVWYQPEVELATGEVTALEALLRWNHRSGEVYSADRFIDVAEETGVLADIGDWVLFQACRHVAEWQKETGRERTLRVNLSANQLAEGHLLTTLDQALELSGLDPVLLCLEVTESSLLRENPTARENLAAARARGIRISIDDFGTGYASLAYLRDMPVDLIKIDRSFITNIDTDERDHRIVAGIVALARRLGIAVTAEGVETQAQADILRDMRCAGAQGYLFARPLPPAQVASFLATGARRGP